MNILHYSLGFPPYRTGGLTKYAFDLAKTQVDLGHNVSLLWPGKITVLKKNPEINIKKDIFKIKNIELVNPIPVPLRNGIIDTNMYMKSCDKKVFVNLLNLVNPDVIHIHTLMGLYKEFIEAAKLLNIKIVFTSHDYFGICPKVNLFYKDSICNENENCVECFNCNQGALSYRKIQIMQSSIYRRFKNLSIVKKVRAHEISCSDLHMDREISVDEDNLKSKGYIKLREYYISMFKLIDCFHFNSENTKKIYNNYFTPNSSKLINILHSGIKDNRKVRSYKEHLCLTYLGSGEVYKGYYLLKCALDEIYVAGYQNFSLNLFFEPNDKTDYMIIRDKYDYSELPDIFDNTDMLVVPSICHETFGLVVCEALSYGVPVIVTDRVGSKDMLKDTFSYIVKPEKDDLKEEILKIYKDRSLLKNFNKAILNESNLKFNYLSHVEEIMKLYIGYNKKE